MSPSVKLGAQHIGQPHSAPGAAFHSFHSVNGFANHMGGYDKFLDDRIYLEKITISELNGQMPNWSSIVNDYCNLISNSKDLQ